MLGSDAQPNPKVASKPIKFDLAPAEAIVYDHVKRNANGNTNVGLRYDTSKAPEAVEKGLVKPQVQKVLVQTALFRKASLKEWDNTRFNRPPSWDVQFSLGGHDDEGSEVHAFVQWLKQVDAQTIAVSATRSFEWFKTKHDIGKLESFYDSLIRQNVGEDGTVYMPTLKAPLPFRYGKPEFDVFGPNGEGSSLKEWEQVAKFSQVSAIIEFTHIKFAAKSFSISMTVRGVQYFPRDQLNGYSFTGLSAPPAPQAPSTDGNEQKAIEENTKTAIKFLEGAGDKRPAAGDYSKSPTAKRAKPEPSGSLFNDENSD